MDIFDDGLFDFFDDVFGEFDYVVVSVYSNFMFDVVW